MRVYTDKLQEEERGSFYCESGMPIEYVFCFVFLSSSLLHFVGVSWSPLRGLLGPSWGPLGGTPGGSWGLSWGFEVKFA